MTVRPCAGCFPVAITRLSYEAQKESLSRIKMRLNAMEELASKRFTGETWGRNERVMERERVLVVSLYYFGFDGVGGGESRDGTIESAINLV